MNVLKFFLTLNCVPFHFLQSIISYLLIKNYIRIKKEMFNGRREFYFFVVVVFFSNVKILFFNILSTTIIIYYCILK